MRTALAAAAVAAGTFALPAVAGPELPKLPKVPDSGIGLCLVPMSYPDVVNVVVDVAYTTAPPVRDAVWTVCAL